MRRDVVCSVRGMDLGNVNLLVAALDLKLVRLIRGAIHKADAESGRAMSRGPAATYEPRRVVHPETRYEARRVIRPEPRFEARPVERSGKTCPDVIPVVATPCAPEPHRAARSPIEPPWKTLPWKNPPERGRVLKVFKYPPDKRGSGSILDCFL
jgi:hypothetical protein